MGVADMNIGAPMLSGLPTDAARLRSVFVVVNVATPMRAQETLRAALGLSLQCHRLAVAITPAAFLHCQTPLAQRCIATLQSFGHCVAVVSLRDAALLRPLDARTEIWQ
jgi:hypothetical protein